MTTDKISLREWQTAYLGGEFHSIDFDTMVKAGWYDWFCADDELLPRLTKMADVITGISAGGKVDVDSTYVWFKNNCPIMGDLYDDFRIADIKTREVIYTCVFNDERCSHKYNVYHIKDAKLMYEYEPVFKSNSTSHLVDWFNKG